MNRRRAEAKGRAAEWLTAAVLTLKGYAIATMRFRAPGGEIDIVARRGRRLHFIEVKARDDVDTALEAIDWRTRRRIETAGRAFLARNAKLADLDISYDAVLVYRVGWRHMKSAWTEGD